MSASVFEARRKAAFWRRLRRTVLVLLAVGLVGLGVYAIWFSSWLAADRVAVEGVSTLKPAQVREAARVPLGEPLATLDTTSIEANVAMMERVQSVEVDRRWPHTVRITIVERQPIAWIRADGRIRALDRYGVDFRTLSTEPKDFVEVEVSTYEGRQRQQALEAAASVITMLRADAPELMDLVQSVSANTKDSVELDLTKGRTVVWGSAAKPEQKLRVLTAMLQEIKATRYDVSAPEQPTTAK